MLFLHADPSKSSPESMQLCDSTSAPLAQMTSIAHFIHICPTTSATTANVVTTTAGAAALSTSVIGIIAAVSFLFLLTLVSTLVLAIALVKVKHRRQRGFPDASSLEDNDGYMTTSDVIYENGMNLGPTQHDAMSTQVNEAYMTNSPTEESCSSTVTDKDSNMVNEKILIFNIHRLCPSRINGHFRHNCT